MNYLKEINAFYDWLETNSISDSGIVLWHALMHICNKAGWVPEFAVAISTLETKTGLKKGAIIRARQRLQQAGRIDFKSRTGQQSAIYNIIPFAVDNLEESNLRSFMERNVEHKPDTNWNANRTQSETQTGPIIKLNKTKLNETKKDQEIDVVDNCDLGLVMRAYENNIGVIRPIAAEQLGCLVDEYPSNWVIEAIKIAVKNNAASLAYIESVLKNWKRDGFGVKPVGKLSPDNKAQRLAKHDCPRCQGTGKVRLKDELTGGVIEYTCDCCKIGM